MVGIDDAQIDSNFPGACCDTTSLTMGTDGHSVKVTVVYCFVTESANSFRCDLHEPMHFRCDGFQTVRAMVDRIHAGNYRQQHLSSAYIAGRLVSANMLLARLQSHTQCGFAA